jgi:sigma-B regulation protein RsbU (phosphoserine phosphatase)
MADPTRNKPRLQQILLVSQWAEDLGELQEKLGGDDYELVQAGTIQDAQGHIEAHRPDLVLLDATGPSVDGAEFLQRLRHGAGTESIPVIIIVHDESEVTDAFLSSGADGFIGRPFRRAMLRSRVRTLLRMKEWHERVAEQNRELLEVNARLDHTNQELMARNRELEQSMEMAHRLQDAMLPQKYPRIANVSFSHMYSPADAVGGDIFHITGIGEGRAAIFIADVSGHGIRAALVTSIVKTVIDYIDLRDKTPSDALKDFNSRFRSVLGPLTPQIYATAVLMFVDGNKRSIALADAGHPTPLLVSKERMTAEPIMSLDHSGPALGFLSDPAYPTFEREMAPGDIVLSFTDGIYEVINEQGEMFGLDRLQALVADNAHLIPRDLIQKMVTETEEFMASPRRPDDVCIVAVEMH